MVCVNSLSTPFWEFRDSFIEVSVSEITEDTLSTPFWEFPLLLSHISSTSSSIFTFLLPFGSFMWFLELLMCLTMINPTFYSLLGVSTISVVFRYDVMDIVFLLPFGSFVSSPR